MDHNLLYVNVQRPDDGDYIPQEMPPKSVSIRHAGHVPAIVFFSINGNLGVPLLQAILAGDIPGLDDADIRTTFATRPHGTKVAYKITWSGYDTFKTHKVATRVRKGAVLHITRREVVRQVAEVVAAFAAKNNGVEPTLGNEKWRVGPGYIELGNVVLLGFEQVSKACVQPILQYRDTNV